MILPLSRFTMTVAVSVALVVMLPYFAWLTYTLQLVEPDISGAVMSAARRSTTESSPTTSRMVTPLADGSLAEISYDDPNAQRLADATASQGGVPICECLPDWVQVPRSCAMAHCSTPPIASIRCRTRAVTPLLCFPTPITRNLWLPK